MLVTASLAQFKLGAIDFTEAPSLTSDADPLSPFDLGTQL